MRRAARPLHTIRLLVLDVDGVMTDGRLHYGARGEVLKVFNVLDGHGIREARRAGVDIAVISGRRSAAVSRRCRELGIRHLYQGVGDKLAVLEALCARLDVTLGECAAVGDDAPDAPLLRAVGHAFAVPEGHASARRAAHRVTRLHGGHGAVREVCDLLVAARTRRR
ncbi:MAG: 3-deoxy-D-manno-octulosonate 8-phosphate phosphatase KdsC [Steroidobacteraceae bacterium]|nr:3-deoxy-D-manno-octulosonate 8-phosphate phosphatase KdsC [Steroidobacteraceae bacterium]